MPGSNISSRTCEIAQAVEAGQLAMFRLAERDHGLSLKIIQLDTGIPYGTLRSYVSGTAMPVSALLKLAKVIPAHLINLMLDPGGKALTDAEPDEADLDDAVIAGLELAIKWAKARHPRSSSGIAIDHTERPDIERAVAAATAAVGRVQP
jgi:hypothetical protein